MSLEKSMERPKRYLSYLLRMWQENNQIKEGDTTHVALLWRASLERPQSGERLGFASLQELIAFLETETGAGSLGSQLHKGKGK